MSNPVDTAIHIAKTDGTYECGEFVERILKAHEFISYALANQYIRTAKAESYVQANLQLLRLHKALTLGKRFQGLFIDSSDEDIKRFSEQRSLEILSIFSGYAKRYNSQRALKQIIKKVEECELSFPLDDPESADAEQVASAIARCCDPDWWRRQIRRRQDLVLEHVHIKIGLVNKQSGVYSSNNCLTRKRSQWKRNEELLASLEAENDLGQVFNLLELTKLSISNLVNRRNELMTRLSGFESIAKERGDVGVFYTITAPSKYHSYTSNPCRTNPRYEGASPSETQGYLNKVWQRIRAKLNRLGIQPYGFRVVEPHHDGTPHWHILLFMPQDNIHAANEVIRDYALAESPDEPGARKQRVKIENIDPTKGSAVGYIAKYIAKNIDGQHVESDLYGFDAIESAERIRAWASNWKIRQFQSIGGPSVTVWREARKFSNTEQAGNILELIGNEKLTLLIDAADRGDWKAFVELSGGPTNPRKEQPLRALHVAKETPNKYGEAINKILGIIFEGSRKLHTRIREWTIRPIALKISKHDEASSTFSCFGALGGANAPPLEFCQ